MTLLLQHGLKVEELAQAAGSPMIEVTATKVQEEENTSK
jgi:hypothetical protein